VKRLWTSVLLACCLVSGPAIAHDPSPDEPPPANFDKFVPGAAELEGRIIAPCCWTQTIDIHGSPISTELRLEVRRRLSAGESAESIEHSLIDRYGPKIMAVPAGSKLGGTGVWLGLSMALAGCGAVFLLRRWQHRSLLAHAPATAPLPAGAPSDAALEARVDAELSRLDSD
jgi:cytochrome c-type biogenesis protein CcmH